MTHVSDDGHDDDQGDDVHPDGQIGNPTEVPQCADLAHTDADQCPDQAQNAEADLTDGIRGSQLHQRKQTNLILGNERERLSITKDDDTNVEPQLEGLEDVDPMPSVFAEL